MNETGGTRGVLKGNLKQRLVTIQLAGEDIPTTLDAGETTLKLVIRGLSDVLKVFAGVGAYWVDSEGNGGPIPAADWPVGAGFVQITPQTNFPDRPKILGRPIFQDPALAVDHLNHPLPQALPYFWNFPGECDEALIEVTLDTGAWQGTTYSHVNIVLQVMCEWVGQWWDAEAFVLAMGQVQITPVKAVGLVME